MGWRGNDGQWPFLCTPKDDNTNFAVLVSKNFTEPFNEPTAYGKYIARLANLLSGGIIVQRLGDLRLAGVPRPASERCITRPTLKNATQVT